MQAIDTSTFLFEWSTEADISPVCTERERLRTIQFLVVFCRCCQVHTDELPSLQPVQIKLW